MSSVYDEQQYSVILNQSNVDSADPSKSTFSFKFAGTKLFKNTKMAVASISMFYSFFNITSRFNNNTFSIIHPRGGGSVTVNITIPDGYYSISSLNSFLQSQLIANNLYLVDGSSNNIYFCEVIENPSAYAIQLNCYVVPTSLPSGWSNPAGFVFPAAAETTQFIIPATNFRTLIGFNAGNVPAAPAATTFSKTSDFTPKTTPVEALIVRSNLVQNTIANPPDVVASFSQAGTAFGDIIKFEPKEYLYLDVSEGYYSSIDITFVAQDFTPVYLNDSSVVIQLAFRTKKENEF